MCVCVTFLKMASSPGSAHRKLSVSLPESRGGVEGQQLVLLGSLGGSGEGPERQHETDRTMRKSGGCGVEPPGEVM